MDTNKNETFLDKFLYYIFIPYLEFCNNSTVHMLHFIGSQAKSWTAVLLFFCLSLGTPPTLMQAVAWDEFVVPLVIATLHSTQMFACKHSLPTTVSCLTAFQTTYNYYCASNVFTGFYISFRKFLNALVCGCVASDIHLLFFVAVLLKSN